MVGLFRRAWEKQLASAVFCDDEVPNAIANSGEHLVRLYMERVAPKIWPAVLHQPLQGVIGAVRIRSELDLIDVDGTVIDIRTSQSAHIDQMHRFELATCARLTPEASGMVRSDILFAQTTPSASRKHLGDNPGRHPLDRCIVSVGAACHAARLLYAEPELTELQPASVPLLAPLRAGFWWRGAIVNIPGPRLQLLHMC